MSAGKGSGRRSADDVLSALVRDLTAEHPRISEEGTNRGDRPVYGFFVCCSFGQFNKFSLFIIFLLFFVYPQWTKQRTAIDGAEPTGM